MWPLFLAWEFCMYCCIITKSGCLRLNVSESRKPTLLPVIPSINIGKVQQCLYQNLMMPVLYFVYCLAQLQLHLNKPKIFLPLVFYLFDSISLDFTLILMAVFGKSGLAVTTPNTTQNRNIIFMCVSCKYSKLNHTIINQDGPRKSDDLGNN